jgi:hypothetical protein
MLFSFPIIGYDPTSINFAISSGVSRTCTYCPLSETVEKSTSARSRRHRVRRGRAEAETVSHRIYVFFCFADGHA